MSKPDETREEALRRLDQRLDALATARTRRRNGFGSDKGAGAGYRLIGELVGGVLGGLGLGWVVDQTAHTGPWGALIGLLAGTGAAVFSIARQASRMSDRDGTPGAAAASAPPAGDDEEDDGPSILGR